MMNRILTRPSGRGTTWSFRAFVAFASLVGIIAMHGLTMNHNTTMAGHGTQTAAVTAHSSGHGAMVMQTLAMAPTAAAQTAHGASGSTASTSMSAPRGDDGMSTACVAFLSGLLFMGAFLSLVQTIRRSRASLRMGAFRTTAAVEYRLKPDLVFLSVMRN